MVTVGTDPTTESKSRSQECRQEPLPKPLPSAYLEELFGSLGGFTETPASFHAALRSRPNGIHPARPALSARRARPHHVARDAGIPSRQTPRRLRDQRQ